MSFKDISRNETHKLVVLRITSVFIWDLIDNNICVFRNGTVRILVIILPFHVALDLILFYLFLRERLWYGLSATDFHNVFYMLTTSVNFWLLMPLIITASILPDFTLVAIRVIRKEKLKVPRFSKTAEKVRNLNCR